MTARVLIVDDSATARAALRGAMAAEPSLEVVGEATDGLESLRLISRLSPDIVTMDLFLRKESGLDLARTIMETQPTPIVIVTAADPRNPDLLFRAMQCGVLDVCPKLPAPSHPDYVASRRKLLRTISSLAGVPVVRRHARRPVAAEPAPVPRVRPASVAAPTTPTRELSRANLLLIGASTGGPPVVARLLRSLPKPLSAPVLLVQHIAEGFLQNFATWLAHDTGHPVRVIDQPAAAQPGTIHLARPSCHLALDASGQVHAREEPPRDYHRPSIDVLFESVAATPHAKRSVALLLTGMGRDGARGLRALRDAGGQTYVQSPGSCAVASMPQRALELGAALGALEPGDMTRVVLSHLRAEDGPPPPGKP